MSTGFRYNVDLLIDPGDREAFALRFPQFAFAFDDPDLRALFDPVDSRAAKAKRTSRMFGGVALGMVTAALVVGAFAGVFQDEPWFRTVTLAAAIVGAAGLVVGWTGLLTAHSRDEWLRQRFVCERLRQLHFQTLVGWAPQIIQAARSGYSEAFLAARRLRTETFKSRVINSSAVVLADLLADRSGDAVWLVDIDPQPVTDDTLSNAYFEALRELRLQHQHDFAGFQLLAHWTLRPRTPLQVAKLLSGIGAFCGLLLLNLGVVGLVLAAVTGQLPHLTYAAMIALAVIALAARTLEEGLQAHSEVNRYRTYDAALRRLLQRHREAASNEDRRAVLAELETCAFDEMVGQLKSHHDARFLM